MTDVWTRARPAPHAIREHEFGPEDRFIGLMGDFMVIDQWDVEARWSLYKPNDDVAHPTLQYTPSGHDLTFETIHDQVAKVYPETNEMHIVYSCSYESPEMERHYINMVTLKLHWPARLEEIVTTYIFEDRGLFEEVHVISNQSPTFGSGYLAICPTGRPVHLFHIATGKLAMCHWHGDQSYDVDFVQVFITSQHLVRFSDTGRIECYLLPPLSAFKDAKAAVNLQLTHVTLLTFQWCPILLVSRADGLLVGLGHCLSQSGLGFITIDLTASVMTPSAICTISRDVPLPFDEADKPYYSDSGPGIIQLAAPISSSSKSILILYERRKPSTRAVRGVNYFLTIRAEFDYLLSSDFQKDQSHPAISANSLRIIKYNPSLKNTHCLWFDHVTGCVVMGIEKMKKMGNNTRRLKLAVMKLVP